MLTFWLNLMVKEQNTDNTQERIRSAAKKIFMTRGLSGARMQDIADEAGINKALLHYYFKNKEMLFENIFLDAMQQFFPKIREIVGGEAPLFTKIENFCRQYIEMMMQNPYLPLFVVNEINNNPATFMNKFWDKEQSFLVLFVEQIEREYQAGIIKQVSPAQLFINMLSMCIFPFIAKPMWMTATGMDELQFRYFMEQRKAEVPKFIIESIKK